MKIQHYSRNDIGRDFVVGDLHGSYDMFREMLRQIDFDFQKDRMFSVGDLVDRGKQSWDCLELVYAPWFHPVMANHEDMMLRTILNNDWQSQRYWGMNGGTWSYGIDKHDLKIICQDYRDKVPYIISVDTPFGRRNIVHAEIFKHGETFTDPDIDNWNFDIRDEDNMLWGRFLINNNSITKKWKAEISITYCGHSVVGFPRQIYNHRYIDTGAVFDGGYLTMVDMTNDLVYTWNNTELKMVEGDELWNK